MAVSYGKLQLLDKAGVPVLSAVLEGETFVLGRGRDSDMIISNSAISRRHVEIAHQPDGSVTARCVGGSAIQVAGKSIERGQSAQLRSGDTIELTLMGSDGAQLRQKEFRYLEPGAATPRRSPFMPRAHSLNGTSPRQALAPKDVNHLRDAMPKDKPSRSTRRGPEGAQQDAQDPNASVLFPMSDPKEPAVVTSSAAPRVSPVPFRLAAPSPAPTSGSQGSAPAGTVTPEGGSGSSKPGGAAMPSGAEAKSPLVQVTRGDGELSLHVSQEAMDAAEDGDVCVSVPRSMLRGAAECTWGHREASEWGLSPIDAAGGRTPAWQQTPSAMYGRLDTNALPGASIPPLSPGRKFHTTPADARAAGQGRSPAGTSVTSLDLGSLTPACQDLHVVPAMVADHDAWGPATPVPETGALGGHPGGGKVKPPRPASVRNERSSGASSQAAGPESAVAGGSVASRGRTPSPKIGDHGAQSAGRGTGGSFPGFPSPQDHTGPVTLPRAWTVTRAGVPVVRLADAAPDARTAGAQVPSGGEGDVSIIIPRELFQASPGRGVVVAIPVPEMDGEASRREEDGEEAEGVTVRRRSGASLLQALPRREEGAEVAVGGTVHEGMAQIDADGDTDEETEEEGDEGETEGGDGGVVPAESESVLDEGLPDDAGLVVVGRAVRGVASFGEQAIAQIRAVARAHKTRAREALRALAALDKRHASLSRKAHAWRKELRQLRRRVATAEAQRDELSAHLARVAGGQADLKGVTGGTVGSERQDPSPKTPVVVSLQVESGGVIDAATVGVQVSPLVDAKAEVAVQVESGVLAETEKSCDEDCGHGDGAEGEDWSLKSGLDEAMVEEVKEEEVAGGAHMTETKTRAVEERVQIEDKEGAEDPCEHAQACQACGIDDGKKLVSCEGCDHAWHLKCAGLRRTPRGDWFCSLCEEGHAAEEKAREINNEQEHAGKGEEKDAREEMSAEEEDDSPCVECGKPDGGTMLLCDGCDAGCHLKCAGLRRVPKGDWFCGACEGAKKEAGRKRKADRPAVGNRERGRKPKVQSRH